MPEDMYKNTIRMPAVTYRRLRRIYSSSFVDHQLSWNKWLVTLLETGVKEWAAWLKAGEEAKS